MLLSQRPSPLLKSKILATLIIVNLPIFLSSCSNLTARRECHKLGEISRGLALKINPNLAQENEEVILLSQQQFFLASEEIRTVKWRDSNIQIYSEKLSKIYQDYSIFTQEFISALHQKDREKALTTKKRLEELGKKQIEIVKEINNYCL